MTSIRSAAFAAVLALSAACGAAGDDASAANDTTAALPTIDELEGEGHADEAAGDTTLRVRMDGIGPLRVGMTVDEARAALGHFRPLPALGDGDAPVACRHAMSVRFPPGVLVMLEEGRVARVDVDTSTVATAEGARVGDPVQRIRQLYPGRVEAAPGRYGDGHYLVVRPAARADTTHLLIFETDGRRVGRIRAGRRPQVEHAEGCS